MDCVKQSWMEHTANKNIFLATLFYVVCVFFPIVDCLHIVLLLSRFKSLFGGSLLVAKVFHAVLAFFPLLFFPIFSPVSFFRFQLIRVEICVLRKINYFR